MLSASSIDLPFSSESNNVTYNFYNFFQTFHKAFCDRQESCEGAAGRYWGPPPILHILDYDSTSPDSHHITGMLWARTCWNWPEPSIRTGDALSCKYSKSRIGWPHMQENLTLLLCIIISDSWFTWRAKSVIQNLPIIIQ